MVETFCCIKVTVMTANDGVSVNIYCSSMPSAVLMTSRSFPHQLVRRHTPKVSGALLQISVLLGSVSSCAKLVQVMVAKDLLLYRLQWL